MYRRHLTDADIGIRLYRSSFGELKVLARVAAQVQAGGQPIDDAEQRLSWLLDSRDGYAKLQPREQKRTKGGGWTRGRAVSIQRLAEEAGSKSHLTP